MDAGHLLAVVAGVALTAAVLFSALQTVVLPRGGVTGITRFVFAAADRVFVTRGHWRPVPRRFAALYAPVALVSLPFVWCMGVTVAFAGIFWGLDEGTFYDAFVVSGSSLFTLGFAEPQGGDLVWLTFVEATIGLGLVALLISFLPTLYTAYSERERGVGLLEPLVGSPPSAVELLRRLHVARSTDGPTVWGPVSQWFVGVAQSHSAFPALCSFPSQQPGLSWVVTAGTVLDSAALQLSLHDDPPRDGGPRDERVPPPGAVLVLAHGVPAVYRVARSAGLDVTPPPGLLELVGRPTDELPAISVTRAEYDDAIARLVAAGVTDAPGAGEAAQAWRRFCWIRSSYDRSITGLAGYSPAPSAPWTSDRALVVSRPRFFSRRPLTLSALQHAPDDPRS